MQSETLVHVILEFNKLVLSLLLLLFLILKNKQEDQGPLVEATTKTQALIALSVLQVTVMLCPAKCH